MANSSRIREALDKTICLGEILSGRIQLDPIGIYTIRLINTNTNNGISTYIEAEIICSRIATLRSFSSNSNADYGYRITINNNILHYSLNTDALYGTSYKPLVYIEYNLKPAILLDSQVSFDISSTRLYKFGNTYFLGTTILDNTNDIESQTLTAKNLEADEFSATTTSIRSTGTITVPHLLVQTVGIENMDVGNVNANTISTQKIILKNPINATTHPSWEFTTANGEVYIAAN